MRVPKIPLAAAVVGLGLGLASAAVAQTAQTAPIAPGADVPPFGLGGIAPGGVAVAPGPASIGDTDIQRIGPGGGRLAPGPAGSLGGSPVISTPAMPGARMR